jgi:hypothetical protein
MRAHAYLVFSRLPLPAQNLIDVGAGRGVLSVFRGCMRLPRRTSFVIVHVRRLRWGFGVDGLHQTGTLGGVGLFGYEPHSQAGVGGYQSRLASVSHRLGKAWYDQIIGHVSLLLFYGSLCSAPLEQAIYHLSYISSPYSTGLLWLPFD